MRRSQESMNVTSMDDIKACVVRLFCALHSVSETLDDVARMALKEALYVFGTALDCLAWQQHGRSPPTQTVPDSDSIC